MLTKEQFFAILQVPEDLSLSRWHLKYSDAVSDWQLASSANRHKLIKPFLICRWISALESNDYKQGKDRLRTGDKFCCLGVYCDLENPNNWQKSNNCLNRFSWTGHESRIHETVDLVPYQKGQLGLYGDMISLLQNLNDIYEIPFKAIAALLRAYYKDCGIELPCET
jgi:hypothetical protein